MNFGLIGENLKYSLSVRIHNRLYELLNEKHEYNNYETISSNLANVLCSNVDGFNVTIPYKSLVIDYLNFIDSDAKELQSVNTIIKRYNKMYGYNTDIIGFELMLKKHSVNFTNSKIVVLGTGASARMVKHFAIKSGCKSVKLVGINDGDITYNDYISGDIVVNTTPVGMKYQSDESLLSKEIVNRFHTIIDLNYNPYRTKLLRYGIYMNKKVLSGLYMLVAQAIKSEELFLQRTIDNKHIDIIYNEINSPNIALIGMMGCGKSTVGKMLAKKLGFDFIDLDEYIMKQESKSIDELFLNGEDSFRKLETFYLQKVSSLKNSVIACGGGVILNEVNIDLLYQNSTVIYVKRDLNEIVNTIALENRPLLNGDYRKKINEIFNARKNLYLTYSEYTVENRMLDDTINNIIKYMEE